MVQTHSTESNTTDKNKVEGEKELGYDFIAVLELSLELLYLLVFFLFADWLAEPINRFLEKGILPVVEQLGTQTKFITNNGAII